MTIDFQTWANLKPETPFSEIFHDRRVPIKSIVPILAGSETGPACYLVDPVHLADDQTAALAAMLVEQNPDCKTLEQAIAYIREGLPVRTSWFEGISSTDPRVLLEVADFCLDDECREPYDEEDYDYEY